MSKEDIYKEIEQMLGLVPAMFRALPESSLELEWNLFKHIQFGEGPISGKDHELLGVAISAATKCRYCSYYHTELAKLHGATEEEIEDAVHYAKFTSGWSAYINGLQLDYEEFTAEIDKITEYVRKMHEGKK